MSGVPKRFDAKDLTASVELEDERMHDRSGGKKPQDFEALAAYLSCFKFKWVVRLVHDEPIPNMGMGGTPQMRIEGFLEGENVKFGKFEVAFHGRRIDVVLPPERQALFAREMQRLLPEPEGDGR